MQTVHTNFLTKKAGPLPVYAYALIGLAVWFLFLRGGTSAAAATLPYTGTSGSAAQQPASGQGTPADNGSADLLAALGNQKTSYDALLSALQGFGSSYGGGGFGGSSVPPGFGSSGGGTSAFSAATVADAGVTPSTALAIGTVVPASGSGDPFTGGAPGGVITGDPEHNAFVTGQSDVDPFGVVSTPAPPDAVDRYLTSHNIDVSGGYTPSSAPTPTVVQPAPVDTSSVVVAPPPAQPAQQRVASTLSGF